MAIRKTPRFRRTPGAVGDLRLQERDFGIIRLAYEYRFVNSEQIAALVAGSDQVILRRLQKLYHHRYLDRPISQIVFSNPLLGPQHMVYGLGDKGADLLSEKLGVDRGKIAWGEKNREVKERYIQHTLMISNFRACLTLALRDSAKASLISWTRENSPRLKDHVYFKQGGRKQRLPITPDGFFQIRSAKGNQAFFLEADRSTMTSSRFLNKMRAYWLWWKQGGHRKRFGIKDFRVLTLTISEQRMENLIRITQEADDRRRGSAMFWFATQGDISLDNPETVLQTIWRTASINDQRRHSLFG